MAVALVVGANSEKQVLEDYNSMQTKVPAEFWQDLRKEELIERDAAVPK